MAVQSTIIGAQQHAISPADKLYMENTLLRIAGALFCHDAKRASTRTAEIELNRGLKEKTIVIRPDPRLGQPGPLAHKLFVAILKKHSNYGRPIRNEVSFTKRELMRLIGRSDWGGRDNEQLTRALNEIHYTFVRTSFKGKEGKFIEHSFNVFPEVYLERGEFATDPVETCVVTLAHPIITSLNDEHFTCLNHAVMQQLGTIAQALYMRLFFHFSNLFDGYHRNRLSFLKRYDDICSEWLGGLTVLKFRSKIENEQLGPHLRFLVQLGFLASYHLKKAANGEGFVITFRPGAVFFADYDRFYRRRHQVDLQFDFRADQSNISEPLKVAYLFIQKRTGQTPASVSSKDKQTARQLLQHIPFDEMESFIDHALTQAKKTRYDPQTLGGIRQYIPSFRQSREHLVAITVAEATKLARERHEATRIAYDRFRRVSADRLFGLLAKEEQEIIQGLAHANGRARFAASDTSIAKLLFDISRARITAQRHPDKILTFEQWAAARQAEVG